MQDVRVTPFPVRPSLALCAVLALALALGPAPPAAAQQVGAAVNWSPDVGASGQSFLFAGDGATYYRYPLGGDAPDAGYPKSTQGAWKLPAHWNGRVDAAVNWGNGVAYLFRGGEYVRYLLDADRPDGGAKNTQANWNLPLVWGGRVDAAVNWGNGVAYLFRGGDYVRYPLSASSPDGGIRNTQANWNLPAHWGGRVDAAINWGDGVAYLFHGDEYVGYPLNASRPDGGARGVSSGWNLAAACYDRLACGGEGQAPCLLASGCFPSCRNAELYEDFGTGTCLPVPPGQFPVSASLRSIARELDVATARCIDAANVVLGYVEPAGPAYRGHPLKTTPLFVGDPLSRCAVQFDLGYTCGAGKFVAGYFTLAADDVELANPIVTDFESGWDNPVCAHRPVLERTLCAAVVAAEVGSARSNRCLHDVVEAVFREAGVSRPPLDSTGALALYDDVCQGLGSLALSVSVDQGLGLFLSEVTLGESELDAVVLDVKRVLDWVKKLNKLLKLRDGAVALGGFRDLANCRGVLW